MSQTSQDFLSRRSSTNAGARPPRGGLRRLAAGRYRCRTYCPGASSSTRYPFFGAPIGGGAATLVVDTNLQIASFARDASGNVYVVAHGRPIQRLVRVR